MADFYIYQQNDFSNSSLMSELFSGTTSWDEISGLKFKLTGQPETVTVSDSSPPSGGAATTFDPGTRGSNQTVTGSSNPTLYPNGTLLRPVNEVHLTVDGQPFTIYLVSNGAASSIGGIVMPANLVQYLNNNANADMVINSGPGNITNDWSVTAPNYGDLARPPLLDGIVEGTAGNDLIDDTYTGDPEGDKIDHGDNTLAGVAAGGVAGSNDDLVQGFGGDDTIRSGLGNDTVYAGDGADSVDGGDGDDKLYGYGDTLNGNDDGSKDILIGGLGNDSLYGGAGDDVLYGDDTASADSLGGNDSLDGGAGNDKLYGGYGNDTLLGGAGNDSLYGGSGFDSVNGGADDDYIDVGGGAADTTHTGVAGNLAYGGEGNDKIIGGAGTDHLFGDNGNDTIEGGEGTDFLGGGEGDDIVLGQGGDDYFFKDNGFPMGVFGDGGNDSVDGGEGRDVVGGGSGNDTVHGGEGDDWVVSPTGAYAGQYGVSGDAGNDKVYGDGGNDLVSGGTGNDTVDGGDGNDYVIGGTYTSTPTTITPVDDNEADILTGGDGNDTFGVGNHDVITDFNFGAGPIDDNDQSNNDFVDLGTNYYNDKNLAKWNDNNPGNTFINPLQWLRADQADGVLNMLDGTNGLPNLTLTINNGGSAVNPNDLTWDNTNVLCFADDVLIDTDRGPVRAGDLAVGDMVRTRDAGLQPLRWTGARVLGSADFEAAPNLRPIRIKAGALGAGVPSSDLVVSPQHRVLVRSKIAQKMFGTAEVLVAAKQLCQLDGIDVAHDLPGVTYIHFLFDAHQIVTSNGAETESLFTGAEALKSVGAAARAEIFAIFPALAETDAMPLAARPMASGRMGRKLAVRHMRNDKPLI